MTPIFLAQTADPNNTTMEEALAEIPVPDVPEVAARAGFPWWLLAILIGALGALYLAYRYRHALREKWAAFHEDVFTRRGLEEDERHTPTVTAPASPSNEPERSERRLRENRAIRLTAREYDHSRDALAWHIDRFLTQERSEEALRQFCEDYQFLAVSSKGEATTVHVRVFDDKQLAVLPPELRLLLASERMRRNTAPYTRASNGNGHAAVALVDKPPLGADATRRAAPRARGSRTSLPPERDPPPGANSHDDADGDA